MAGNSALFVGVQGTVLALDASTGTEPWKTSLKGRQFVNVTLQGARVIATTKGEVFALDPATGQLLWNNKLSGLGLGFVTVAGAAQVPAIASRKQQDDAAAASAAAAG